MDDSARCEPRVRVRPPSSPPTTLKTESNGHGGAGLTVKTPSLFTHTCKLSGDSIVQDIVAYDEDKPPDVDASQQHCQELAMLIMQRIRKRLPGRIHRLGVRVSDNAIVLVGQCNTYYSKQMAQHVAMGVLDYERLINNISVGTAR